MHGDISLPSFNLTQVELPELAHWQVNGEYYLVLKVKLNATHNQQYLPAKEDKPMLEGEFQITSVRAVGDEPIDVNAIEKADFEQTVANVKSGVA